MELLGIVLGVLSALLGILGLWSAWQADKTLKKINTSNLEISERADTIQKMSTDLAGLAKDSEQLHRAAVRDMVYLKDDIQATLLSQHKSIENLGELIAFMYVAVHILEESECVYLANCAFKFGKAHEVSPTTLDQLKTALGEILSQHMFSGSALLTQYNALKDKPRHLHNEVVTAIENSLVRRAEHGNFGSILLSGCHFEDRFLVPLSTEVNDKYQNYGSLSDPKVRSRILSAETTARQRITDVKASGIQALELFEVDNLPIQFICGKLTSNNQYYKASPTDSDDRDRWLSLVFFVGSETLFVDSEDRPDGTSRVLKLTRPGSAMGVFSRGSRYALTCTHLYGWMRSQAVNSQVS